MSTTKGVRFLFGGEPATAILGDDRHWRFGMDSMRESLDHRFGTEGHEDADAQLTAAAQRLAGEVVDVNVGAVAPEATPEGSPEAAPPEAAPEAAPSPAPEVTPSPAPSPSPAPPTPAPEAVNVGE
jgi:hypothetical protein